MPRVQPVLLYPLFASLPSSAKRADNSNTSAHTVVRLHAMTSPHFWGLPDTQQAHASIGQKNCPSAAGKRGEVMSLRSRRLVCGTVPRRGYTVRRQFFTVQRRYSCANGSVLTTILLRHKNAWPWDASLDTCNSDETDSHASITNGNENRFRSFRLKKRDDKIIFGLSEKPDRENHRFFKMQFSKTSETETDSRFLIRTATWPKRSSHSFRRSGEKTLSCSTLPTTTTLSGSTFSTAYRLSGDPLSPHR